MPGCSSPLSLLEKQLAQLIRLFFSRLAPNAGPLPLQLPRLSRQREVLRGTSGVRVLQGRQPEPLQGIDAIYLSCKTWIRKLIVK